MTDIEPQPAPRPQADTDSEAFWQGLRDHRLELQACLACARRRFPVTPACPFCGHSEARWERSSEMGEVYSFVVVRRAFDPAFEHDVPYVIATVDLDGGGRIVGRGDSATQIGCRVKAEFVDHEDWTELRFMTTT